MQKNKIKIADFTPQDKYNLVDLFVNNERTLMYIYEALFPPRQSTVYPGMPDQNVAPETSLPQF